MFDPFVNELADGLRKSVTQLTITQVALVQALVENGLVTWEQVEKQVASATHAVDQELAAVDEERQNEFDEKHPGLRKTLEKLLGGDI